MEQIYKEYLFQKHILVNDAGEEENLTEVWFSLANLLNIRVTKGREHLHRSMIRFAQERLGQNVPQPFYTGFPQSVRELTADQLLFDQIVHYATTYGFGNFDRPGHSLMEHSLERLAFRENARIFDFEAVDETEGELRIAAGIRDLCASTRPLSEQNFQLVLYYVTEHGAGGLKIASSDTKIRLLAASKDLSLSHGLSINDVLKVTERLYFDRYMQTNWKTADFSMKKLNLKNQERKFITKLLRRVLSETESFRSAYEKQALWCGLLHHIHFTAQTEKETAFVTAMRSGKNDSVYAEMERYLSDDDPNAALWALYQEKGTGAVLRQADYLLSRDASPEAIAACAKSSNPLLLIQLLSRYANDPGAGKRMFSFTHLNLLRSHTETDEEQKKRRSHVPEKTQKALTAQLRQALSDTWKQKLGTVYVSDAMKKIALPISEASSEGGLGVLPKGSRIALPEGKKLRAFTYWEKVDDIDLSVIGLDDQDRQIEFSWRTMAESQSEAITFSGDQTSGFEGGSEYFDIDLERFQVQYPAIRYLIFCNNVFSRNISFATCVCRAGYMVRDTQDSGEIFEPKTVSSAYTVNAPTSYAYLFALDLNTHEFVWLNAASNSHAAIAGMTSLTHLKRWLNMTDVISLYDMLKMQAAALTDDPLQADVVASDEDLPCKDKALRIHSYDIDTMLRLIEGK